MNSNISNDKQADLFNERILADIALKRTLLFRLNFWINICKYPVSHGNYYWNSSPEHRVIAMLSLAAYLKQIPISLSDDNIDNQNYFTVTMVRSLTHVSERKIQRIIKFGIDRKDFILVKTKPYGYQATKQLLSLYEVFEKTWIDSQKEEIKMWKKSNK